MAIFFCFLQQVLLTIVSRKMEDLKSKKANFVCEQAPATCQIHFTCKGNLIHTRFQFNETFLYLFMLCLWKMVYDFFGVFLINL